MNELVVQFVITLPSNLEFEMSFDADISISHRDRSVVPFDVAGLTHFVQKDSLEIIIFGADIAGKAVAQLLKKNGLEISCFIDNNKNKCSMEIDGKNVLHSSKLSQLDKTTVVLIASTYIADIISQLESCGFNNWAPISFIVDHYHGSNYREIITGDLQRNHAGDEFTKDFVEFTIENMVNSQKKYLDETLLFIRSVDLILTEKCSLKCKDCSNLMQYYKNPTNIHKQELIDDLNDLMSVADEVNEIRIIGGEPLMNKDFHEISAQAAAFQKVKKVVIYTNGTICPPDTKLQQLKNEKIFVFITTYGELSRNAERLRRKLEELEIQHNCQPAYGWTECGGIGVWGRTDLENTEIFSNCCAKHFTTMTDGKIFRCPFSANVERLMAIPEAESDFISLRGIRNKTDEIGKTKEKLRWFLREKPFLSACDSCNGRTYGDPEITPGIQTNTPIEYTLFDRI